MKKLLIAAGVAALAILAGCATPTTTTTAATGASGASATTTTAAAAALAKLQTTLVDGCNIVQPALGAAAIIDPSISAVATANGLVCATVASINATSAQTLLNTGIPAIEAAINASTLVPADQKPVVIGLLGVFGGVVTNALNAFNASAAAAPVSAASAASAS